MSRRYKVIVFAVSIVLLSLVSYVESISLSNWTKSNQKKAEMVKQTLHETYSGKKIQGTDLNLISSYIAGERGFKNNLKSAMITVGVAGVLLLVMCISPFSNEKHNYIVCFIVSIIMIFYCSQKVYKKIIFEMQVDQYLEKNV